MNQIASHVASSAAPQTVAGVTAPLQFIRRQRRKPAFLSAALTGGAPELLFDTEARETAIHDMRPIADALSVDREGFELVEAASAVADFYDDAAVEAVYHAEVEDLLKRRLGASRVEIFDTTRRSDSADGAANPDGRRGPASRVHVDYTENSGPARFADVVGEREAARLAAAGARVAQVNVWRPIAGPVERAPLALADAASIAPADLIATDQVFPDRTGEIYHLAQGAGQRWFYAPRMTPAEALLIKGWDSDAGRARFTPHSAFDPPDLRPGAAPRESIEVRTYVIFE